MEYALNNPTSSPVMPPTCSTGLLMGEACMMQRVKIRQNPTLKGQVNVN